MLTILSLGLLASLLLPIVEYDRGAFGGWWDADGDCLNTRQEVLLAESLVTATVIDCRVVSGLWFDPFTGQTFVDPGELDVDHLVPLKEAFISGASEWYQQSSAGTTRTPCWRGQSKSSAA